MRVDHGIETLRLTLVCHEYVTPILMMKDLVCRLGSVPISTRNLDVEDFRKSRNGMMSIKLCS